MDKKNALSKLLFLFLGIVLLGVSYVLFQNFKSLRVQKKIREDLSSGVIKMTSKYVINAYPKMPSLTVLGEPVGVQKARYLLNEKKHTEAYKLLANENSSPFDGRADFFLAMSFYEQKKYDSVIKYAEKCFNVKPRYFPNLRLLTVTYEHKQDYGKAVKVWKNYIKHTKHRIRPWREIIRLSGILGNRKEELRYTDSIRKRFPNRSLFKKRNAIRDSVYIEAKKNFENKNYKKAIALYSEFITKNPNHTKAFESRAFCYYFEKDYNKSNLDIDIVERIAGNINSQLINLRGVNYYNLKELDKACESFKRAKNLGDKDGISNFAKICR